MANAELAKKIVGVMTECRHVEKDGFNNFQKYKYATAAAVISMVNDALTKYNVATISETKLLEMKSVTDAKGNNAYLATVELAVTLIDADSGEEKKIIGIGSGFDSLDKSVAKAQTMALKYAYMSSFGIAQGDDPDADNTYFEQTPSPGYNGNGNGNSNGSANWSGDGKAIVGKCEECGKDVNEKSAYYSKKNFNKLLCYNCQQKRKAS